ncbi:MAG: hypothetical protein ACI9MR_000621 [Myxococcota bacterium]|jgi:hypothetical protein
MFVVITENNSGSPPNAAYCRAIRDAFGLTMPVLYDPTGEFLSAAGLGSPNAWGVVTSEGVVIENKSKYSQTNAHAKIREILER